MISSALQELKELPEQVTTAMFTVISPISSEVPVVFQIFSNLSSAVDAGPLREPREGLVRRSVMS